MDVHEKLEELSDRLQLDHPFESLDDLIEAYCSCRAMNQALSKAEGEAYRDAREHGKTMAYREAKANDYFSRERLRGMTLAELAELLAD